MSALDARILHIECIVVKYFDCIISILFSVFCRHISLASAFFALLPTARLELFDTQYRRPGWQSPRTAGGHPQKPKESARGG